MKTMKTTTSRRPRRGQALIEMSLVVILLLFLTLGLIQYGLLANARTALTNVAREGARYAALHARTGPPGQADKDIEDYVDSVARTTPLGSIKKQQITITTPEGRNAGSPINVAVSYNMRQKFIIPGTFPGLSSFGSQTTASAEMIIQ